MGRKALLIVFAFASLIPSVTSAGEKEVKRDGHYILYDNGVVYDEKTGLEWVAGPDNNTTWDEAKSWVKKLTLAGGGWRMPSSVELRGLYQKGKGFRNMTPLLETTGWGVWPRETKGPSYAWHFNFIYGLEYRISRGLSSYGLRVFAVRSRK
jgi:hypothetical protein